MVTVSTSLSPPRAYHHGDLSSALLDAGLKALETTDFANISLRQLARDVGVSATAVYRHFPDKQALMQALANQGIASLGEFQQAASADLHGPDAFAATGRAYVRWALANPALFRLTFSQSGRGGREIFGDNLAGKMLEAMASETTKGDPAAVERLMVQAWSLVHGLAMLMLDNQLPADQALIERVIDIHTLFPPPR